MKIRGTKLKSKIIDIAQDVLVDSVIGLVYIPKQEALNALLDEDLYEVRFSDLRDSTWVTIWKMY